MHCIVGLGNYGSEYASTRHNVGFQVVDAIAYTAGATFHPGKGEYWLAQCSLKNTEAFLLKPVTYMNNSGIAVHDFLTQREISIDDLLVICDDFQLPLGTIRLRPNGTDGGHHGLSSVIYHLQSDQFARLRCGIASSAMPFDKAKMKDFVLEQFTEREVPIVQSMIDRARDASISFMTDGIERTMNRFNTQPLEEMN